MIGDRCRLFLSFLRSMQTLPFLRFISSLVRCKPPPFFFFFLRCKLVRSLDQALQFDASFAFYLFISMQALYFFLSRQARSCISSSLFRCKLVLAMQAFFSCKLFFSYDASYFFLSMQALYFCDATFFFSLQRKLFGVMLGFHSDASFVA